MANNAIKGRDYVMSVSVDAGTTFLPIAGIRVKELTRENPVADITNQANTSLDTGSAFTGYGTVTISGSGTADTTTTTVYEFKDLVAAANSATPSILMKLENTTVGIYEGDFNITSFGVTAEQNGIVEFNIALQNEGPVTFTAGV